MKVGDRVVCVKSFVSLKGVEFKITKGDEYEVLGVSGCNTGIYIKIGRRNHWGKRFFRKIEPLDTASIAAEFTEVIEVSPVIEPEYA